MRVSTSTYSYVCTWARILRIVASNKNLSGNKNQPNENRPRIKVGFAERYLIGERTSLGGAQLPQLSREHFSSGIAVKILFLPREVSLNVYRRAITLSRSLKLRDEARKRLPIVNLARHDWISRYCVSSRWGAGMRYARGHT